MIHAPSSDLPMVDDEELGRIVASRRAARRVARGDLVYRSFLPGKGRNLLSVDRLSRAPLADAVANGERVARAKQQGIVRTGGRPSRDVHFCGWRVLAVRAARAAACRVVAAPIESDHEARNPYHAEILLPAGVETDEARKACAQELALAAVWRARPNRTNRS